MNSIERVTTAKMRLVETGGRTSQELGAGRIVGQVLVFLYLQEQECSLDAMGAELGLSKASVSIAARQLEHLGLVRKVRKSGDRKNYYTSADNIGSALQQGIISIVQQRVQLFGRELDSSLQMVQGAAEKHNSPETEFLQQRISRARKLQRRLNRILGNPLVRFLTNRHENE